MKTRNIITIISIIFALVSCSSENDILNEMPSQNTVVSGIEATISCVINNVQTRAAQEENDEAINHIVYFLLDNNGDVLGYRSTSNSSASFQTKNQKGLSVLAVANATTDVTAMSSRDGIMDLILSEGDLNSLVKVGEKEVTFGKDDNASVQITVNQIAARIDLSSLTLTITDADVVKLESVELKNQNTAGKMNGTTQTFAGSAKKVETSPNVLLSNGENTETVACHFYSFANGSENATSLVLHFDIDGKKVSKEVKIKLDGKTELFGVKSGANYKLSISAKIQGENVIPEVSFTVADWNKSQISVDMND